MRLAFATAIATLTIGPAVTTACTGGSGSTRDTSSDAGPDVGPCDPQSKPVCPTACQLDYQAECLADGWACPAAASAFECAADAMPECDAGAPVCVCSNLDAGWPSLPVVWLCPGNSVDAGASDADAAFTCPPPVTPPPGSASQATVNLVIWNSSNADRYVATAGFGCEAFGISEQGTNVPLLASSGSACEGVDSGSQATFQLLGPDASASMTWDGREAVYYNDIVNCWPQWGMYCATVVRSVERAVVPGNYSVSVAYSAEAGCAPAAAGGYTCMYPGWGSQCGATSTFNTPPTLFASQTFTVPDSGTTTVTVAIP